MRLSITDGHAPAPGPIAMDKGMVSADWLDFGQVLIPEPTTVFRERMASSDWLGLDHGAKPWKLEMEAA